MLPIVANVTANHVINPDEIRNLLFQQITSPVKWRQTMLLMENVGIKNIVEIGSGKVLAGLVSRTCKEVSATSIQNIEDIRNTFL